MTRWHRILVLAMMFASAFVPAASPSPARAPQRPAPPRVRHPSDIRAEAAWFRLSHYGRSLPSPDVRQQALDQLAAAPLAPKSGAWSPLGPQPIDTSACSTFCSNYGGLVSGRITALAANPATSGDLWAGAADGGVWHSTDGGQTWAAKTDTQTTLSTGALAVDPLTPSTLYVGTGEGNLGGDNLGGVGLLKSSNGGTSWTRLGYKQFAGLGIARVAVNPANSQVLLVSASYASATTPPGGPKNLVANTGIWRSTDAGSTWTQVLADRKAAEPDAGTDVLFDPVISNTVFAGLGNVLASTATVKSGVWRSTAGGAPGTWSQLTNGIPTGSDVERVSLAMSADGSRLYAVLTDGDYRDAPQKPNYGALLNASIYVSTDAGTSWTALPVPADMAQDMGPTTPSRQWWYNSTVGVDPTSPMTVYAGGVDLWRSLDGGTTWTNLTQVYSGTAATHPDQHAIAFQGATPGYYLGNDGGVWSNPGGGAFTSLNGGGLNITQFYGGSAGNTGAYAALYGGAQDNGETQYPIYQFNTAQPWTETYGGDGGRTVVDYTDNAIVYEEYVNGALSKSTDGGATWASATTGINLCDQGCDAVNFVMPFVQSASNNLDLVAGTSRVYRTLDGAGSWTPISAVLDPTGCSAQACPLSAVTVAPSDENTVYAGDNAGNVYATSDGGFTWNGGAVNGSTGGMVTSLAVDPVVSGTVYATFADYASAQGQHIFKSSDAGQTWQDLSNTRVLPNAPFESILVNPGDGSLVAGSDAGIFRSTDDGVTWARYGTGLPNAAVDQAFLNHAGTELYVATHGRGMWTIPLALSLYFVEGYPDAGVHALNALDGTERWQFHNSSTGIGNLVESILDLDGQATPVLYAGSNDGSIVALRADDGSQLWSQVVGGAGYIPSASGAVDGVVYVHADTGTGNSYVYAFDAASGTQLWKSPALGSSTQRPVVANGLVYTGDLGFYLYALKTGDGSIAWSVRENATVGNPTVSGGVLYLGLDNNLAAVDGATGATLWEFTTGNFVSGAPTVVHGVVYFGSSDNHVYALHSADGSQIWSAKLSSGFNAQPQVVNGLVYASDSSGKYATYALKASDGSIVWRTTNSAYGGSPVVAGGITYNTSDSSQFYGLAADTGKVSRQYTVTYTAFGLIVGP